MNAARFKRSKVSKADCTAAGPVEGNLAEDATARLVVLFVHICYSVDIRAKRKTYQAGLACVQVQGDGSGDMVAVQARGSTSSSLRETLERVIVHKIQAVNHDGMITWVRLPVGRAASDLRQTAMAKGMMSRRWRNSWGRVRLHRQGSTSQL